jgi:hypothetical protein
MRRTIAAALLAGFLTGPVPTAQAASACTSTAHALDRWKVTRTFEWYYNPEGQPVRGLESIKRAMSAAFSGQNGCGQRGINVRQVYKGLTSKKPAVPSNTSCGRSDGASVVGWGSVGLPMVARTCTWYRRGSMTESDMLFNTSGRRYFLGNVPANCNGQFDVESVVMHEGGHILGITHVSDTTQTMWSRTLPCATSRRVFYSGDMAGLRRLYG